MRQCLAAILIFICLQFAGCALPDAALAHNLRDWTQRQGGEVFDTRAQRLTAIGTDLLTRTGCTPERFHVLQNAELAAYSWASGDIYLTTALLDQATDDEIAASLAHELGHLLNNGDMHSALSLRGLATPVGLEERADCVGCQLLVAAGHTAEPLIHVLQKVCAASPSAECRDEIQQRIAAIRRQYPQP